MFLFLTLTVFWVSTTKEAAAGQCMTCTPGGGCTYTDADSNSYGGFCEADKTSTRCPTYCVTPQEPATTKPAPDTTKPPADTTKPAPDATKPAADTTKPAPDTTKPVSCVCTQAGGACPYQYIDNGWDTTRSGICYGPVQTSAADNCAYYCGPERCGASDCEPRDPYACRGTAVGDAGDYYRCLDDGLHNKPCPVCTKVTADTTKPATTDAEATTAVTKPARDTTAAATKPGRDTTAAATKPARDTTAAATKPAPDTTAAATKPARDTTAAATKPGSDTTAAATKPARDTTAAATKPARDTTAAATKPARDTTAAATKPGRDTTAAATKPARDTTAAATKPGRDTTAAVTKEATTEEPRDCETDYFPFLWARQKDCCDADPGGCKLVVSIEADVCNLNRYFGRWWSLQRVIKGAIRGIVNDLDDVTVQCDLSKVRACGLDVKPILSNVDEADAEVRAAFQPATKDQCPDLDAYCGADRKFPQYEVVLDVGLHCGSCEELSTVKAALKRVILAGNLNYDFQNRCLDFSKEEDGICAQGFGSVVLVEELSIALEDENDIPYEDEDVIKFGSDAAHHAYYVGVMAVLAMFSFF